MPGAKVIRSRFKAQRLVILHDPLNVSTIFKALDLGELEHDTFSRKTELLGSFQRRANTQLRLIDGVGKKIDTQHRVDTQLCCQGDSLDATKLIEWVAIIFIYAGNN